MDNETFRRKLSAVRVRGDEFQVQAQSVVGEALLPMALEEFSVALEELRVTEEEVRVQNEELTAARLKMESDRDRYRDLFELAPAAYLVTDRLGIIKEANRRAASLLGVAQRFLVGRPLAMFVAVEDRFGLRDRLGRLGGLAPGAWRLRLRLPGRQPVTVTVATSVIRDQAGEVVGLRWLLVEAQVSSREMTEAPLPRVAEFPSVVSELASRPPVPTAASSPAPDWRQLAEALRPALRSSLPLLRAEGAGLMLADEREALRWVVASDESYANLQQAERDLGEGPCIDAIATGEVVSTSDLRTEVRWPCLAAAARANRVGAALAAPMLQDGRPVGACDVAMTMPRIWTEEDKEVIRGCAALLGQLVGWARQARRQAGLAAQLQQALSSRVLIEQAKGVLMERHGLDEEDAFAWLRRLARSRQRKLTDVAREVIGDRSK